MQEQYHKWHSTHLDREFEMLVFGHAGFPVIVFPTARGRYFEAKDFGLVDSAAGLLSDGKIKLYCPDSIDSESWYNFNIPPSERVEKHRVYEELILKDVIRFAQHETKHKLIALAGCGFGGYHAANLAFRHPNIVSYMFSMGGIFDIKQFIMGHYDDECYFNNPPDYLGGLNDEWYLKRMRRMNIILGTGDWDISLNQNTHLSNLLNGIGVNHTLEIRPGAGHNWNWWKEMFPDYLSKIHN